MGEILRQLDTNRRQGGRNPGGSAVSARPSKTTLKEWLPLSVLKEWFDEILGRTDPRPSDPECEKLIWKLRIHFNQQQNTELKRPLSEMKDANPIEILNTKVEKDC